MKVDGPTSTTPGMERVRIWWGITLLTVPAVIPLTVNLFAPRPSNQLWLVIAVGYVIACPLFAAVPGHAERLPTQCNRSMQRVILGASWVLAGAFPGLVTAIGWRARTTESAVLCWMSVFILALIVGWRLTPNRSERRVVVILRVGLTATILALLLVAVEADVLQHPCLLHALALGWRQKAVTVIFLVVLSEVFELLRRTHASGRRALRAMAITAAALPIPVVLFPVSAPTVITPAQIAVVKSAALTSRGDLVLAVELKPDWRIDQPLHAVVFLRKGQPNLVSLTSRPDGFMPWLSIDRRHLMFAVCPPLWREIGCGRLSYSLFKGDCPEAVECHGVDLSTDKPTTVFTEIASDNESIPDWGPRNAWIHRGKIHLASGRTIDTPAPPDRIVRRWFGSDELVLLWQADSGKDRRVTHLSRIQVDTGAVRTLSIPIDKRLRWYSISIAPSGRSFVASVPGNSESTCGLAHIDTEGRITSIGTLDGDKEPRLIWRRDGQVELVGAYEPGSGGDFEHIYQFGDELYTTSWSCRPRDSRSERFQYCLIRVDRSLKTIEEIDSVNHVQWLDDSIVYASQNRRVVRFWPESKRSETRFRIP